MIKLRSNEKQVMSTKALLDHFKLTEDGLIWYINATQYQLANPGKRGLEYMGIPIRCMYPEKYQVEAWFEPIKKGEDSYSVLVALDLKRVVLFVSIENLSYEVWLGYKQQGESYCFFEELYVFHMYFSRKCHGSVNLEGGE